MSYGWNVWEESKFHHFITGPLAWLPHPDSDEPIQVTFALGDRPSPWSIAAGAHAANLPVMMHPHPENPSRGFVTVLTVPDEKLSPELLAKFVASLFSTNVQGYFLIVHFNSFSWEFFHGVYSEFYRLLGTTRVLQLSPNIEPYVNFAKPYDPEWKLWTNVEKRVVDFCRDQRDERTRHLRLSNGLENLEEFRFSFIIRENDMWFNARGVKQFGGRDFEFAKLLVQLGMRLSIEIEDKYDIELFRERLVEVILPVSKITAYNLKLAKPNAEITVVALQATEHLVVRRAQRMPFGLVLLLPFRWQTWCSIGVMVAVMVVAWTLVRTHQVNFVDAANGALDVLEMVLTGGTSRPIPLLSHRLVFVCGFLMWLVAANAYTGLLLGFLTVPQYFNELDTIQEVVQATDRLYVENSVYLNFEDGMTYNLGKLAKNVTQIVHSLDRDSCVQDVVQTGNAAAWMNSHLYSIVSRYRKYTKDGRKLFHRVKEPMESTSLHSYFVRRNHRILYVLNSLILRLLESGLSDHWHQMLEYSLDLDGQGEKSLFRGDAKPERLKVVQFTEYFALYCIGILLAGITFIVEQI